MNPVTIQTIKLHPVAMPFLEPLRTSFGMEPFKGAIIVEAVTDNGVTGWGEASTAPDPGYTGETMATAYHMLDRYLAPQVVGVTLDDPRQVQALLSIVRYHEHAKHGLEAAVWDAFAKVNAMRLVDVLSHYVPDDIPGDHSSTGRAVVGVSIGLQSSLDELFAIIDKRLAEGYGRIKLKIKPGADIELARAVRERYPAIQLMLDANSAYSLDDAAHLSQLDAFNLLMIEQPLAYNDIYEHSKLQPHLQTPICLDESIKNAADMQLALEVGAVDILNLKPARVGGFTESLALYGICVRHNTPLWIGGMLETGIGRAANVALASLPGVTLPCDISATDRYFDPDITDPPFVLQENSTLAVPDGAGIGVSVARERLDEAVAKWYERDLYNLG
jgi:O-succinylbenzoate synthase